MSLSFPVSYSNPDMHCSPGKSLLIFFLYFKIRAVSKKFEKRIVLRVPSFPKPEGNSGSFRSTPESDIHGLFGKKMHLMLESYFTDRDWSDKRDWLKKYGPSYSIYFDKNMKIFAYSIMLKPEVFTQMSEEYLKGFGEELILPELPSGFGKDGTRRTIRFSNFLDTSKYLKSGIF